ncbi:MAG: hypothetical protein DMD87_05385 [Candidatus Rokuibacteriota bacterium]|nr:MAG: hypothetical protein DMD87_05385 [Candidatus Rokubacteria bacterium]
MVGDEAAHRRVQGLEGCPDRRARARWRNAELPDRWAVPYEKAAGGQPAGLADLRQCAVDAVELPRNTILQDEGRGALRLDPRLGAGQRREDVRDPFRELRRRLRRANFGTSPRPRRT